MKSLKIAAFAAITLIAAGCSSAPKHEVSDIAALRSDIAEVKSIALQANDNAMVARQLAEENSQKINRVFRGSQRK